MLIHHLLNLIDRRLALKHEKGVPSSKALSSEHIPTLDMIRFIGDEVVIVLEDGLLGEEGRGHVGDIFAEDAIPLGGTALDFAGTGVHGFTF